jgi:hypothetical protein
MPTKRRKPSKARKPVDRKPALSIDPERRNPKTPDDRIDEELARYGLTVPVPRGQSGRVRAAKAAIRAHLYDPTSPEAIAQDDTIDNFLAQFGLTVPFPRGHPSRLMAADEVIMKHLRSRVTQAIPERSADEVASARRLPPEAPKKR